MSVENCGNCAFGVVVYGHQCSWIDCHRHAPIVFHGVVGSRTKPGVGDLVYFEDIMGAVTAWPKVGARDFCGEFELKDVPLPAPPEEETGR